MSADPARRQYHADTAISARFDGWPDQQVLLYVAAGLVSAVGEVAGELKKAVRDDGGELTPDRRRAVLDGLGDVLWYAARIAESVGGTLDDAVAATVAKVHRRAANGTIAGSGDR